MISLPKIFKNHNFTSNVRDIHIKKLSQENKWLLYIPKIKINLLNEYSIELPLKELWKNIMNKLPEDKFINLLLRLKYEGNDYKTLEVLQKVNKNDFKELLEFYKGPLNYKTRKL